MSNATGARTIDIGGAIKHLVELGLVAVERGAGARANTYLPALPKRLAASLTAAAADDAPPF